MNRPVIFAIVCALFAAIACKKTSSPDKYLNIDRNTIAIGGTSGSSDTIYISSNDEWKVTVNADVDWLHAAPSQGTGDGMVVLTSAFANTSTDRKTTIVEISALNSSLRGLITVIQLQMNEITVNAVFGGEGYDTFNDIAGTTDGGYMAVGVSASTDGDGAGSKGGNDVWVVKFSSEGEKIWHKKFGGSQEDAGLSIVRTPQSNYIVLASTLSTDGDVSQQKGGSDAWLLAIDEDGNLQWQKAVGGSSNDWLQNLKPAGDGNYLMAGWTYSSDGDIAENKGDADAWIVKVNGQGDIVWESTYGGTKRDIAYDATPVSDGGYIFCGGLGSTDGDAAGRTDTAFTAWFAKLNPLQALAGKVFLGESEFDYATVALEASNGDYVFAGQTASPAVFDGFHGDKDAFICRLDPTGNVRWEKAYGGSLRDEPGDLIETNGGDFILGGRTTSTDGDVSGNKGEEDAWLIRVNGGGDIKNSLLTGGAENDNIRQVKQLGNNHFVLVGLTGSYEDDYPQLAEVMHGWFQVVNFP